MLYKTITLSLFLFALTVFTPKAFADCTTPAAAEGALEWDTTAKKFKYCDGTSWNLIDSGGSSGAASIMGYAAANMVTQTVLASANVSSVTFNSGDFIINWSTAITGNYGVVIGNNQQNGTHNAAGIQVLPPTSTSVRIATYVAGSGTDLPYVTVAAIQ